MSSGETPPSVAVVDRIAQREDVPPAELRPPLWEVIDPDALDRLFEGDLRSGTVRFQYSGYTVRVDEDARVRVAPAGEPATTG